MIVNQINTINNIKLNKHKPIIAKDEKSFSISFCGEQITSEYGKTIFAIQQMEKLKKESDKFPQDSEYRKQLLQNAGLNSNNYYKIRSIIGPQEIEQTLAQFSDNEDFYSTGESNINVTKGKMRANLHCHTLASDGSMTVEELLDKAVSRANVAARNYKDSEYPPFVIAITDHDTTESAQEAIKLISENPIKYRNLRVILGVEMTTYNNIGLDIIDIPSNVHTLVYGIDPNETKFKNFLETTKEKKLNLQYMMIDRANSIYEKHFGQKDFYSVSQVKNQYNTVDKNIVGIYNGVAKYCETKAITENVLLKNEKIRNILEGSGISTETDGFMTELAEYQFVLNKKNSIISPYVAIPKFLSTYTDLEEKEVYDTIKKGMSSDEMSEFNEELLSGLQEYKITKDKKHDYMPTFKTLYDALENQNVLMGVAHPLEITDKVLDTDKKYLFLEDLYSKFKSDCKEKAKFTEAYYQSYKPHNAALKNEEKTKECFDELCAQNGLYKTGSYDTHGKNILRR